MDRGRLELMWWHDATVHALAFEESDDQAALLINLDYIVRWIEPQPPSRNSSFLVAPATLVFENVPLGLSHGLVQKHDPYVPPRSCGS